jgi:ATP-dependent RNA helicase DeaD
MGYRSPCMTASPFAALGLNDTLVATLTSLGYEVPTPIQERTIPALLGGRDLIGQAQTGTGKTAAFALPILQTIDAARHETQALILAPTRELAVQVSEALHSYAHGTPGITVMPVYGGAPIVPQLKRLDRGVQIVVGTPGRLIDVLGRGSLRLESIRMVVLDEADEMLKMGFIDDVETILSGVPKPRQIALFSATMPAEVLRIAQRHLVNPERVEIERKTVTAPDIEQRYINVSEGEKLEALTHILEIEESEAVLIFRRTKNGAAELAERLEGRGFAAVAMHGDMKQAERESVIRRLRAGQAEIVVATDVAARGLDVEQIAHVINYDIPYDVEAYVHRVGRTGRAGRTGLATLFVTPREKRMMREIEQFTGSAIKSMKKPTRGDVAARRLEQTKEKIRKAIGDGELEAYVALVEQLVEEGQHSAVEIAAAAVRLASPARAVGAVTGAADTPAPEAKPREEKPRPANRETVRLRMDLGKRDGIRPADVVGSIANESGLTGREIGPIEIRDTVTYVGVPADAAEHVIASVSRARFRGKAVNMRIDRSASASRPDRRPAKPYDKRPKGPGDKLRKGPFEKRPKRR